MLVLGLLPLKTIQGQKAIDAFNMDSVVTIMHRVNDYQIKKSWGTNDRNWKRATYYSGLMAFYQATKNPKLLEQAIYWGKINFWQVGSEWYFPANRYACVQTYLEVFFETGNQHYIRKAKGFMDNKMVSTSGVFDKGWFYIDALYVAAPTFVKMSKATEDDRYINYINTAFWDVADRLYDEEDSLFYRDLKARNKEKSEHGKKVLWSRGNGWVVASLPQILNDLPENNSGRGLYIDLLKKMAASLKSRQRTDGFWSVNLGDPMEYNSPESSGTAFFIYALSWGVNNGFLKNEEYHNVITRGWQALYSVVDEDGKVCWGQREARGPGKVKKEDSDEFVSGAFLLAGSEILKYISSCK